MANAVPAVDEFTPLIHRNRKLFSLIICLACVIAVLVPIQFFVGRQVKPDPYQTCVEYRNLSSRPEAFNCHR